MTLHKLQTILSDASVDAYLCNTDNYNKLHPEKENRFHVFPKGFLILGTKKC